jgi:hypothetical protein
MDDTEYPLMGSDSLIKCLILPSIKEFALVFSKGEMRIREVWKISNCGNGILDDNSDSTDFKCFYQIENSEHSFDSGSKSWLLGNE